MDLSLLLNSEEISEDVQPTGDVGEHDPAPFKCLLCGNGFSLRGNLNKHVERIHERRRPHRCTRCYATFGFRDGFARHMWLVHEGEPRVCTCPEYNATFNSPAHRQGSA